MQLGHNEMLSLPPRSIWQGCPSPRQIPALKGLGEQREAAVGEWMDIVEWAKGFCMRKWRFASLGEAGINKEVGEGDPADCKDLGEESAKGMKLLEKTKGFLPFEITREQAKGTKSYCLCWKYVMVS